VITEVRVPVQRVEFVYKWRLRVNVLV